MSDKVIVNIGVYDFALCAKNGNIYIKQTDYASENDESVVVLDIEQIDFFIRLLKKVKREYEIKQIETKDEA
jgi:uncharacterized protein with ACT and thioredoxin-like domain